MKKNLTVYKASAGSGKTFTLAVEYIKLLIENPENYKHILAVTFTNKATGEMKSRILSQLFGISRGLKSSEGYVNALKDESRLGNRFSDQTIKDNASTALTKILHDYSNFNVTTIDAFFQKIMRNMARELGLPANTSVDLDHNKIETLAVDRILDEMTPNDEEYKIVNGFVNEKIDDNKSWNVTKDIKDFGNQIFSSSYRAKEDEVKAAGRMLIKWNDSKKWSEYTKRLKEEKEAAVNKIKSYGERYRKIISEGEKDALPQNAIGIFEKFFDEGKFNDIKNKTYYKCLENAEELLKAAYRSNSTMMDKASELHKILVDFEADTESAETINSVDLTLKHLSSFRLLNVIREKINGITEENNISLLSDTQDLLSQMLTEGDATFIYEKTGSYISHIMIDEFQDTSETQWKNFKILIDECISHGTALIVGDVKQSIYRWRGGDWRLLSGIGKKEYEESTRSVTLDSNYRSEKNIIDFNNSFFKKAEETARESIDGVSDEMKSELENAYKDVEQKSPKTESRGEIVVTFKGEGEDVNDEIANRIITLI
ncbi:MAG: UvrD-helicase domain-containing protein, partial [Paludibacteraceae bacterium]|nr:UvrD-helicase domain-containing protein [Paludibacteraceae bacterium]